MRKARREPELSHGRSVRAGRRSRLRWLTATFGSALETESLIKAEGGECFTIQADVTREEHCWAFVEDTKQVYDRVDVLHKNVGIGAGDDEILRLSEHPGTRSLTEPERDVLLLKERAAGDGGTGGGSIINISSIAAVCAASILWCKTSKAAEKRLQAGIAA